MSIISWLVKHIAPIFLITSPVTSYADQILSISRTKSSAGFSLDIPLIMLTASILKLFYWIGAQYDNALLIQAGIMVLMQLLLLHVALLHRPAFGAQHSIPFAGIEKGSIGGDYSSTTSPSSARPYNFWRWRARTPYWEFLAGFTIVLCVLQVVVGAGSPSFVELQGYVALGIEALLPVPQLLENWRARSCKGFRPSVLVNWLVGDAFKMSYFFLSAQADVPWAFRACGIFQACCDVGLGLQWWVYGNGSEDGVRGDLSGAEMTQRLA